MSGPAFAIDRSPTHIDEHNRVKFLVNGPKKKEFIVAILPGPVCLSLKFSSANFDP